jgi:hypothetical protein
MEPSGPVKTCNGIALPLLLPPAYSNFIRMEYTSVYSVMEDDEHTLTRLWCNLQINFNHLLLVMKRVVTVLYSLHIVNRITINLRNLTSNS